MDRARAILDAAQRLFYERGFDGVGVDLIGERAGMTGPGIYRYFQGKEEILAALLDEAIDGALSATGGMYDNAFDELGGRVKGHARYVIGQHELASVWIREARALPRDKWRRIHRRETQYVALWADCIRRCYPHVGEEDATAATTLALGALNSMAQRRVKPRTAEHVAERTAAFVLGGLEAHARMLLDA